MPRFTAEFDQIKVMDTDGTEWEVAFTREVDYSIDPNYGADADGKNGERRVDIDEDNHVDTQVNYGGVWTDVDKLHPAQQHAINAAIETWKQDNEPMIPDA
jgi:hypothetical protein